MATKFILYARKSTESEERQILSLESQIAELRAFAEKEKLQIVAEYTEAMTAKEPGRPIFNQVLNQIEKGEAQGIVTWHPDRLARNSVDGGRIIYLLDKGFLKALKFPTFWFENTPQGKFMMTIAFGQSKYYIDNLSENIRRGHRQKLRRGEWPLWAPMGYLNDKQTRKVVVDPIKGPLVKRLFEYYAEERCNFSYLRSVAASWGLVSRKGTPISKEEIRRTFSNTFFYGIMKFNGELHQGTHEPLITKALFEKVQEVMKQKGKLGKFRKHEFPFIRFMTCKKCGCFITAERQKGHHYYRCSKKKGPCNEPYVREEILDQQITKAIQSVSLPTNYYTKMLAELAQEESQVSQKLQQTKEAIATPLKETTKQLEKLLDIYLKTTISHDEYVKKRGELLQEKVTLEEKLTKLQQQGNLWLEPCRKFLEAAHQAHQVATDKNLAAKRKFLLSAGSNFCLTLRTLEFSYQIPWSLLQNSQNSGPLTPWRRGWDSSADTVGGSDAR